MRFLLILADFGIKIHMKSLIRTDSEETLAEWKMLMPKYSEDLE